MKSCSWSSPVLLWAVGTSYYHTQKTRDQEKRVWTIQSWDGWVGPNLTCAHDNEAFILWSENHLVWKVTVHKLAGLCRDPLTTLFPNCGVHEEVFFSREPTVYGDLWKMTSSFSPWFSHRHIERFSSILEGPNIRILREYTWNGFHGT